MVESFSLEQVSLLTYAAVFGVGVLICFTPCVYPIIPVLVGFLGGTELSGRKDGFLRSLSYVLGMASMYALLGAVVSLTGGLFGLVQNNVWTNLIVANILIGMGLFMLDVFHLPPISFLQRPFGARSAGIGGAFVMGAVSGAVVGPCTTPVLGALLAYAALEHNLWTGISLLFTYALGMGAPLLILGTFIGLLKKMPKAGDWMVRVKKIFGLLLIASGEFFLIGMR